MAAQDSPSTAPQTEPQQVTLPTVEELMDENAPVDPEAADADADAAAEELLRQRYRLPMAAIPDNAMLQSAAVSLVVQKEKIDLLVRDGGLLGLLPDEWSVGSRPVDLKAFVLAVVPFVPSVSQAEAAPARVPLKYLLGDSTRWRVDDVAVPKASAAYLASDDRALVGSADHAEVFLLTPLGVCWAHEGKSRVGFLRSMQVETMAARVTALPYPPAAQLALYNVVIDGVARVWCVLEGRKLRQLVAPWLTLPLLSAYGVASPQAWPARWPPVEEVAAELASQRGGGAMPEADLVKVAAKVARDTSAEGWLSTNLLQMNTWVPRWRFFLGSFIGLPAGLLILAALALPGNVEAAAVAAALGFAGGAIAALAAPWVYVRRKHLN